MASQTNVTEVLLIIDMQDGYFSSESLNRQKRGLIKHINRLVEEFTSRSMPIINVMTVHSSNKRSWTLNMLQDDQGFMLEGTDETATIEGLNLADALRIFKTRDSAFHKTDLLDMLCEHKVDRLVLCGVTAHSCIFHTAADAYAHNFPTRLVADAIGDEDPAQKSSALEYLEWEYRQKIEWKEKTTT